jgi:hypothetical protein
MYEETKASLVDTNWVIAVQVYKISRYDVDWIVSESDPRSTDRLLDNGEVSVLYKNG